MKQKLLKVEVKNNILHISIGVDTLFKTCGQDYLDQFTSYQVEDRVFIKDVINELTNEAEDGTTLLHQAFAEAIENAIENGSEGIERED